jgi:hypothetical protein
MLIVPDSYNDPKTQATFKNRFDMKHIKKEVIIDLVFGNSGTQECILFLRRWIL